MLGDFVDFCGGRFLKYFLFVYGGILSFPKGRGVPRPGAGCLRRVTFVNSDKSNQKRHSRGKGFRFPFPLENPPSLKRPKGRGCDPSPLETSPRGVAIIKSRLCRSAAKVGGGQGPLFESIFLFWPLSFPKGRRVFRAPARVTFGRSPKSDQKVCLKPKVSRLPARYVLWLSAAFTARSREFDFVVRSKGSSLRLRRCR